MYYCQFPQDLAIILIFSISLKDAFVHRSQEVVQRTHHPHSQKVGWWVIFGHSVCYKCLSSFGGDIGIQDKKITINLDILHQYGLWYIDIHSKLFLLYLYIFSCFGHYACADHLKPQCIIKKYRLIVMYNNQTCRYIRYAFQIHFPQIDSLEALHR